MEASQDLLDEQITEARHRADQFSLSVRTLLVNYGGLTPELIEGIVSRAYEQEYDKALTGEPPVERPGQIIDLGFARGIDPEQVELESVALDAFKKILSGEFGREERIEREEELLALDYQPPTIAEVKFSEEDSERYGSELDNEVVKVYSDDIELKEDQRFLLEHLADVNPDKFRARDFFALGYGSRKTAASARKTFQTDIVAVQEVLQQLSGQPILIREGNRGGTYYHLDRKVTLITDSIDGAAKSEREEIENTPTDLKEEQEIELKPRRHRDLPILRKAPPTETKKMQPIEVVLPGYLRPEEIKTLDEVVASFEARDEEEVLNNRDLKLAIEGLMNNDKITDYRTRVVLAVRYGLYPPKFRQAVPFIRRGQETVRLDSIMDSKGEVEPLIKRGQGLDIKSASELLTMHEVLVLQTELDFLKKHKTDSLAIKGMVDKIEVQLNKKIKEQAASTNL